MMNTNRFEDTSVLRFRTYFDKGKTNLGDCYFTAPFKVAKPFYIEDTMKVVVMSASAGMMEGDTQEIEIEVGDESKLYFTSQSYEKIHKMESGFASRNAKIKVGSNATLRYVPLCTIPFAKSRFEGNTKIWLESDSSKLFFAEIFAPGRKAYGEVFEYDRYLSRTQIWREDVLIYHDNTKYIPDEMDVRGYGIFEKWTHLLNIFVTGKNNECRLIDDIRKYIKNQSLNGGVSVTAYGDISIKVLGDSAQTLENVVYFINELIN